MRLSILNINYLTRKHMISACIHVRGQIRDPETQACFKTCTRMAINYGHV